MYSRCDCPRPPSVLSGHSVVDLTPDTPGRVGVIGFAAEARPRASLLPWAEALLLSVLGGNAQTELTGKCEKDTQKGREGLVTATSLPNPRNL